VNAPPFPRTEADLAAWHVYADWLLEQRDPRGPLIALDLSLPSVIDDATLSRYRREARAVTRRYAALRKRATTLEWRLGHVRAIAVHYNAAADELLSALARPELALLEAASIAIDDAALSSPRWLALLGALPPSCRRVDLFGSVADVGRLIDSLPPSIDTLGVWSRRPERFVTDRLRELVVFEALFVNEDPGALLSALARTRTVRLRASNVPAWAANHDRIVAGRPGDAAIVAVSSGAIESLPPLYAVGEGALFPVRVLLGRTRPEYYGVFPRPETILDRIVAITRRPDGRYVVRPPDAGYLRDQVGLVLDGAPLPPKRWTPLSDGARLTAFGADWTFVEDVARLNAR
jgi:uncharacterized protein (TIGR02996 family)